MDSCGSGGRADASRQHTRQVRPLRVPPHAVALVGCRPSRCHGTAPEVRRGNSRATRMTQRGRAQEGTDVGQTLTPRGGANMRRRSTPSPDIPFAAVRLPPNIPRLNLGWIDPAVPTSLSSAAPRATSLHPAQCRRAAPPKQPWYRMGGGTSSPGGNTGCAGQCQCARAQPGYTAAPCLAPCSTSHPTDGIEVHNAFRLSTHSLVCLL